MYMVHTYDQTKSLREQILESQTQMQYNIRQQQLNLMKQQLDTYGVTELYGGSKIKPIGYIYNTPQIKTNCVNCGAPLKSCLCEYCGTKNN